MKSAVLTLLVLISIGCSTNHSKTSANYLTTSDLSPVQLNQIRAKFESQKYKLFSHYSSALKSNPKLKGKLKIELMISPSGRVEDFLVLNSQLKNDLLEANLSNEIQSLDFGSISERYIKVNYIYTFIPN